VRYPYHLLFAPAPWPPLHNLSIMAISSTSDAAKWRETNWRAVEERVTYPIIQRQQCRTAGRWPAHV